MKNRGCFFLFLFLLITRPGNAENVAVQAAALQVQVFDYAGLNPAETHELILRIQQILTSSGVSVEVDACVRDSEVLCESRSGSRRQVVIRVVNGPPTAGKNSRWQHLGQSFADRDGGAYATIFLEQAKEQAGEANLSSIVVLAYAAAHEVGHLLLGGQAHTPRGLMKPHWERDDFQAMAQSRLHFSTKQLEELASRYGTQSSVGVDADTTVATRH
jgi:hypothetical protein